MGRRKRIAACFESLTGHELEGDLDELVARVTSLRDRAQELGWTGLHLDVDYDEYQVTISIRGERDETDDEREIRLRRSRRDRSRREQARAAAKDRRRAQYEALKQEFGDE